MEFVEPIRDKDKILRVKQILQRQGIRDYLMFLLGINSGLRISDILNLKVKDVKDKKYIEVKEQKTHKFRRILITNAIKETLETYIYNKKENEWLFLSRTGAKPISRIQAYRIIHNACLKAGITCKTGTHTLRKTFGYHFYKTNKDIALLQYILNHSSPSVTMRYIGINQDIVDDKLKAFCL